MEENYKVEQDICDDTYVGAFDNIQLKGEECTKLLNRSLYKIGRGLEIQIAFHMVALTPVQPSHRSSIAWYSARGTIMFKFISCLHCSKHKTKRRWKNFEHRSIYKFNLPSPRTYDRVDVFELHL